MSCAIKILKVIGSNASRLDAEEKRGLRVDLVYKVFRPPPCCKGSKSRQGGEERKGEERRGE